MRQAPLTLKLILNFLAYIGYTLLLSIIFSFGFPLVLNMLKKELYNSNDPIFVKIQISIALLVLVLTVIFRKNFYLSLIDNEDKEFTTKVEQKTEKIQEKKEELSTPDWLKFDNKIEENKEKVREYNFSMDDEEEDFKIYTDKEIKR